MKEPLSYTNSEIAALMYLFPPLTGNAFLSI
jgi:hypothetical protein